MYVGWMSAPALTINPPSQLACHYGLSTELLQHSYQRAFIKWEECIPASCASRNIITINPWVRWYAVWSALSGSRLWTMYTARIQFSLTYRTMMYWVYEKSHSRGYLNSYKQVPVCCNLCMGGFLRFLKIHPFRKQIITKSYIPFP